MSTFIIQWSPINMLVALIDNPRTSEVYRNHSCFPYTQIGVYHWALTEWTSNDWASTTQSLKTECQHHWTWKSKSLTLTYRVYMEQRSIYPHQGGASPPRPPSEAPNLFTLSWASLVFGRSSAFPSIEASNVKVSRWQAKRIKFCLFFSSQFHIIS